MPSCGALMAPVQALAGSRCDKLLGKSLESHSASLHSDVQMGTSELMLGLTLRLSQHLFPGASRNTPSLFYRNRDKLRPDGPLDSQGVASSRRLTCVIGWPTDSQVSSQVHASPKKKKHFKVMGLVSSGHI